MAKLAFKNQQKGSYKFANYSGHGVSSANKVSEGSVNTWNKLNEEAITEASIGSINDINDQIEKLTDLMNKQKSKLRNLISADSSLEGSSCNGDDVSCDVPSKLSQYANNEIDDIVIIIICILFLLFIYDILYVGTGLYTLRVCSFSCSDLVSFFWVGVFS